MIIFYNRIESYFIINLQSNILDSAKRMFKKLQDNNEYNARYEYIRSFGEECLGKIKRIQIKFNQIQLDMQNISFQSLLKKVKVIVDSYQSIAYCTNQIYDSCQSVQYDSLGQSVLKIILQIASTIKWLMTSFLAHQNNRPNQVHKNIPILPTTQNESQKFRNRQISRYILKGVVEQMNLQENSDNNQSWDQSSITNNYSQKQTFQKSKNKLLSISPSNLPLLLQDTVDSFQKRAEYIDKFVALRQNYEGSFYRNEQIMSSQAILQCEFNTKNKQASQKIKEIVNKFYNSYSKNKNQSMQNSRNISRSQYGVQVDSNSFACVTQKFKKVTQKNKAKTLNQQLQKQRSINNLLRAQIEQYQKKLTSILKQNQQLHIVRKQINLLRSANLNNRKTQLSRAPKIQLQNHQPIASISNQNQNKIKADPKDHSKNEQIMHLSQQLSKKNLPPASQNSEGKLNFTLRRIASKNYYKPSKQESQKVNDSYSNSSNYIIKQSNQNLALSLELSPKVFNIQLAKQNQKIDKIVQKQNLQSNQSFQQAQQQLNLKIHSKLYQVQIKQIFTQKTLTFHKDLTSLYQPYIKSNILIKSSSSKPQVFRSCTNTPCASKQQKSQSVKQVISPKQQKKNLFRKQEKSQKKIIKWQENLNKTNQTSSKVLKFEDRIEINVNFSFQNFQKIQIKNVEFKDSLISQFFIDEPTMKNYQLLNLSESNWHHKKIKHSSCRRSAKINGQVKKTDNLCLSSCGLQKLKFQNISAQTNSELNIISKKIHSQILSTRKVNKDLYHKLSLFLKYPYSCLNRWNQMSSKIDQFQQKPISLSEISLCIKRIWSIHSKCVQIPNQPAQANVINWCRHKKYIIEFFGYQQITTNQNQKPLI